MPASTSTIDTYLIKIIVKDAFNLATPNIYEITAKVMQNLSPTLKAGAVLEIPTFYVG